MSETKLQCARTGVLKQRNITMKTIQKKICLLGDFAVGKTSLVRQFVEGRFDDEYLSTIGVKISRRTIQLADEEITANLLIWDLAGGDDYSKVTSGYLAGASGVAMACDLTRKNTLTMLEIYARQLDKVNKRQLPKIIFANKVDLKEQIEITEDALNQLAENLNASWFFSSAKTGEGVENGFTQLAKLLI
ncbi:MAG: Rab family GTPase [Chloroflexota bacterium]